MPTLNERIAALEEQVTARSAPRLLVGIVTQVSTDGQTLTVRFPDGQGGTWSAEDVRRLRTTLAPAVGDAVEVFWPSGRTDGLAYTGR